jgi:hypothetical protein
MTVSDSEGQDDDPDDDLNGVIAPIKGIGMEKLSQAADSLGYLMKYPNESEKT